MNFTSPCAETPPLFATLIHTLLTSQCLLSPTNLFPSDYGPQLQDGDEFDFVIVGAGSSGSVVASRLSENPNWKVLLLEAGTYPSAASEIPRMFPTLVKTEEDWAYVSEPIPGLQNRTNWCPRGKALGGSSTINGMLYLRGNRHDYDAWAEEGNIGWDYDSVIQSYRKFENRQEISDHDHKGRELKLTKEDIQQPVLVSVMQDAYKEKGYGIFGENEPIGSTFASTNIWEGKRMSSAKAFLSKAKDRENLRVVLKAHVGKLLVNDDLSVSGVEVRIGNTLLRIKARKEVILSAGAVNSPQILMNSGIGPRHHLQQVGIPVMKNLKVGQNLQDHLLFSGVIYEVSDDILVPKSSDDIIDELYQYFMHRKGPLGQSAFDFLLLFANPKLKSDSPSIQIYSYPMYKNDIDGVMSILQNSFGFPIEALELLKSKSKKHHHIFFTPTLTYPNSRGQILLRSSDPFDLPKIFTNHLSDPNGEDLRTMLDAIRLCQNVTKTNAFIPYAPKLVHVPLANCKHLEPDSDDYWECLIRNLGTTSHHLVGTCKMGPGSDPDAVVDERLRVHGMRGLRVVDASIMPRIVSCNLNPAIIMIGQKGATMIKEDWEQPRNEL